MFSLIYAIDYAYFIQKMSLAVGVESSLLEELIK